MKWLEIAVRVVPSDAPRAAGVLLCHCPQGIAEAAGPGGMWVLRAYTPAGRTGRAVLGRLRADLRRGAGRPPSVAVRVVDDRAWIDAWKARAAPITIGRLTVRPSWLRDAEPGGVEVRLDPGMAFGSGEHPTTRLCLAAVERLVPPARTVIDVGTGSGILAIAAARLGATRVLAVDNDPAAAHVARLNVRANRVASRVAVREGDGLRRTRRRADLIVANLTAPHLLELLPIVAPHLAPGGVLVGSGFIPRRAPAVARAVRAAGLRVVRVEHLRGWSAVHAAAPPGASRGRGHAGRAGR